MRKKWSVVSGQWSVKGKSKSLTPRIARALLATDHRPLATSSRGFTLMELVITLTVLTILTMSVIPLVQISVKRQREQRLRDTLREMRTAIDQFHREAIAAPPGQQQATAQPAPPQQQQQQQAMIDPRVRVAITDTTIFTTENPDRYPPDLETLVNGVSVTPLQSNVPVGGPQGPNATDNALTSTKKKVYLRQIPIDPMTGESDWELRSTYDTKDSGSWGGENVFDVRSKSNETALDGSKYSDW